MSTSCPGFEILSRFADGDLEEPLERGLLAHVAGCEACRKTLASIEEVDGLLVMSLPARAAAPRRFRILRPALLPLAAALLFALTLSFVLARSPGPADSPLAVAELAPPALVPPAEPVANVFLQDRFQAAQLSTAWSGVEASAEMHSLVDVQGRKALQLSALTGGKKRWALLSAANEFPVAQGVSFDIDYRIPKAQKGGRMQILLQAKAPKAGRAVLRWSRTFDEELLEAQADGRSKPSVLWSSKVPAPDTEWHQLEMTVSASEVVLLQDGAEVTRQPHGLSLERAHFTLGSTMDKRAKETHETFECQVGRVLVRKKDLR